MRLVPLILLLATTLSAQTPAEVQSILAPIAKSTGAPLAAAVVRTDGAVSTALVGKAKNSVPLATVTKPIAVTVLGSLVDQGFITWETTISNVFPEWRTSIRPEYAKVTLAQLLSHEGRIQPFTADKDIARLPTLTATTEQRRAFVQQLLNLEPLPEAKRPFAFSHAGYAVAEAIAERITGEAWEALVRERVFHTFDMKNAPELSLDDVARLARAHLVALHGQDTIVKAATARVIHAERNKSALGFAVQTVLTYAPISVAAGTSGTMRTYVAVAPKQNLAVVITTAATTMGEEAAKEALGMLIRAYAPPVPEAAPRRPIAPPRPRVPGGGR